MQEFKWGFSWQRVTRYWLWLSDGFSPDLICRSCHCALSQHGQPEAAAETTRSSTRWSLGCRTPRWRGSRSRSYHQSRTGAYPGGRQRNWLSWGRKCQPDNIIKPAMTRDIIGLSSLCVRWKEKDLFRV